MVDNESISTLQPVGIKITLNKEGYDWLMDTSSPIDLGFDYDNPNWEETIRNMIITKAKHEIYVRGGNIADVIEYIKSADAKNALHYYLPKQYP